MRRQLLTFIVALTGTLACTQEEQKPDTPQVIDEVDIYARDTTPKPPPSRIGRLQLFGELTGGTCQVRNYRGRTEITRQFTYEASSPRRVITLAIGQPGRSFAPLSLTIIATQSSVMVNEQESFFVGFTSDGKVEVGTRQYTATGAENVNERQPVSMADGDEALRFARAMLALCTSQR